MNRPFASLVPDAIDQIVARVTARAQGTDLTVRDGPWTEGGTDPNVVVIGFTGFFSGYQFPTRSQSEDFGSASVTTQTAYQGLGAGVVENFTIACASIYRTGDTKKVSAARKKVYANVTTVAQVLLEPPLWIQGRAMSATIGPSLSLDYVIDRRGLLCYVAFSIDCSGFAQQ